MPKLIIIIITSLFILERIKATFLSSYREPRNGKVILKWVTYYLIVAYALVILLSCIEFLVRNSKADFFISLLGLALLLTGRGLRNSSIAVLKKHNYWSIHTKIFENQKIIKEGPYAYLSNPYYFGTMLELTGICFFLNSFFTVSLRLVFFIPVLIFRIIVEEKTRGGSIFP